MYIYIYMHPVITTIYIIYVIYIYSMLNIKSAINSHNGKIIHPHVTVLIKQTALYALYKKMLEQKYTISSRY